MVSKEIGEFCEMINGNPETAKEGGAKVHANYYSHLLVFKSLNN